MDQLQQIQKKNIEKVVPGHVHVLLSKQDLDKHIVFYKSPKEIVCEVIQDDLPKKIINPIDFFELEADIWKSIAVECLYNFYKKKYNME